MRQYNGKPITYKRRQVDQVVYYDGKAIALLFKRDNVWSVVLQGDFQAQPPIGVDHLRSRSGAVEYALKAHNLWVTESPHSLLSMSRDQQLRHSESKGMSAAARHIQGMGAPIEYVRALNKLSDEVAYALKEELDAGVVEMFKDRKDVDPSQYFTNLIYLRST